jgi:hypothetical protein
MQAFVERHRRTARAPESPKGAHITLLKARRTTADYVTGREEYFLVEDRGKPEAFAHMAIRSGASLLRAIR